MEFKYFRKGGRLNKVLATNKVKISRLKEDGFVEVEIKNGEIKEIGKVEQKDYDSLVSENKKLKAEIKKLKKQLADK